MWMWRRMEPCLKIYRLRRGSRPIMLVGGVTAPQGDDGKVVWGAVRRHWDGAAAQSPTGGCSRDSSAMGESLTEQCRVQDEGPRVVNCCHWERIN